MPFVRVAPVFGVIVMVFGLTMLVPAAVAGWIGDGAAWAYLWPMLLTLVCGGALWLFGLYRGALKMDLQARDGSAGLSPLLLRLPVRKEPRSQALAHAGFLATLIPSS